jgi:hypothetical protein
MARGVYYEADKGVTSPRLVADASLGAYGLDITDEMLVLEADPLRAERLHWSFEDTSRAGGQGAARFAVFRRVRDEIRTRVKRELTGEIE